MECIKCKNHHEVKWLTSEKLDKAVIYYTCKNLIAIVPTEEIYKRVFKEEE